MTESPTPTPRYSLILSAYESHTTLRRSLESLRRQTFRDFDTIVVDSSPHEQSVAIARDFPEVTLIRPGRRMTPHEARNAGAARARGAWLVLTDPDCVADPEWLAQLDASARSGHRFVGGPIGRWPGGLLADALYLSKFWKWLPNGDSGPYPDIPSANLAIERGLYDAVGGVPEAHISGDTEFCFRVRERTGCGPWLNDRALTRHITEATWRGAFGERLVRGRAFGLLRTRGPEWSRLHSACLTVGWPLFSLRHVWTKFQICRARRHLGLFLRTWPIVGGLDTAWMLGQAFSGLEHLCGWRPDEAVAGDGRPAVRTD